MQIFRQWNAGGRGRGRGRGRGGAAAIGGRSGPNRGRSESHSEEGLQSPQRGKPDEKDKTEAVSASSASAAPETAPDPDTIAPRLNRASSSDAKWQRGVSLPSAPANAVQPPTASKEAGSASDSAPINTRQGVEDLWDDVGGHTDITEERGKEMVRQG